MSSVARQARSLDSITADLLTAAQIQRGSLRVELSPTDPLAIVNNLISDRFEDVTVTIGDHRMVDADPLRLEQMLGNLLSNAYKYGAPPYTVSFEPAGSEVHIRVTDSGGGVPADFRDRLFVEFSRAPGTTSAPGTGLGLYVVRTLAAAQGGSAGYEPGHSGGSVFTITLPSR